MNVGEKVKELRKIKKISINKLSKLSNVNASYISKLERGENNKPSVDILNKIANSLDVPLSVLTNDDLNYVADALKEYELYSLLECIKECSDVRTKEIALDYIGIMFNMVESLILDNDSVKLNYIVERIKDIDKDLRIIDKMIQKTNKDIIDDYFKEGE
ncbi:helix-turn-helix domain-containing protein [Clostridium sporogenes]|uniref:helix-turn-helix domain-containing protein n=1 Tax=Clostridium sporogenes TaxID=1509 RepID=UPI00024BA9C7|nr:helix-turn-helix transcriptional regulator [Clostridium sporogenes]EHN13109.1 hypothetical protein IYC_20621 [Clostridium sporogenes PA 3679]MDU4597905.1 helix-turn-helix transcriptional regulator [Clostridium sporogenes]NFQ35079.1 helix-turn-helix transcriptional regulator [Clostridium sporogenes]NFQ60907.1 helix-turn-helix transcriptional regulator [Clostridium sporogenes]NFU11248.1 helix-turn-helix transcriptional regulator [Clostridium sporogenes]